MADPNPFETPQVEILKKISKLEDDVRRLSTLVPLFTVLNENTPAQITANQNNYVIGDYDVLLLSTDASRNITGFAGGVKGRIVTFYNVGSQNIVLVHESALSLAANRFTLYGAANKTFTNGDIGTFYYDSTTARWREYNTIL